MVRISLIGLTPTHFCACLEPKLGFPTLYGCSFLCSVNNGKKIIVRFVDIHGIIYQHCLNLISISRLLSKSGEGEGYEYILI